MSERLLDGNLDRVLDRWESWWNRTNDAAIVYFTSRRPDKAWAPASRSWMPPQCAGEWTVWMHEYVFGLGVQKAFQSGDDRFIDEACDFIASYYDHTQWFGDGYPFLHPSLGPAHLPVFISGYLNFVDTTFWLEPEPHWSLDRVIEQLEGGLHPMAEAIFRGYQALTRKVQKRCIISAPDFGTGVDVLSAFRGPQDLLLDLMDEPDKVHRALDLVYRLWRQLRERFDQINAPGNHGASACVMRYVSRRPMHLSYCDFCAMISPEMFGEFVLPYLKREAAHYPGRVAWHLDGPGQIRHVPMICSVPEMHAIQWVQGAGNAPALSERWYPLYRQILDLGRRICLAGTGDAGQLREFFKVFPAREFTVPASASTAAEAQRIIAACAG